MRACTACPAYRLPNNKPHGFCPLGFEQVRQGYIVTSAGDCPKPKDHSELMHIMEALNNDAISERE